MKRNTLQSVGSIVRAPGILHFQEKIKIKRETERNPRLLEIRSLNTLLLLLPDHNGQ